MTVDFASLVCAPNLVVPFATHCTRVLSRSGESLAMRREGEVSEHRVDTCDTVCVRAREREEQVRSFRRRINFANKTETVRETPREREGQRERGKKGGKRRGRGAGGRTPDEFFARAGAVLYSWEEARLLVPAADELGEEIAPDEKSRTLARSRGVTHGFDALPRSILRVIARILIIIHYHHQHHRHHRHHRRHHCIIGAATGADLLRCRSSARS